MARSKYQLVKNLPRYLSARKIKQGKTAYYWQLPSWAKKQGCTLESEALGNRLGDAVKRAEYLNSQFDEWKADRSGAVVKQNRIGTVDWLIDLYLRSPQFTTTNEGTQQNYEVSLKTAADHRLVDGARFGSVQLNQIMPGVADRLHARIMGRIEGDSEIATGPIRPRAAQGVIVVLRRAWNVVHRTHPEWVAKDNPFSGVATAYKQDTTYKATYEELQEFVAAAKKLNRPSIAAAAMISFYWLMRPEHVREVLKWDHYQTGKRIEVWHEKTGVVVDLPLRDENGGVLFQELEELIETLPRRGPLLISCDIFRSKSVGDKYIPYKMRKFSDDFKLVRNAAGLSSQVTPETFRHGGLTEAGTVGSSDQQILSTSGHKTRASVDRYINRTDPQKIELARKRGQHREGR